MEIEEGYIPTSRKKTPREQTISDVLKLDKEIKTFNKDDYSKLKKDGMDVEKRFRQIITKAEVEHLKNIGILDSTTKDEAMVWKTYSHPIFVSNGYTTDEKEIHMQQTELFFGFTFDSSAEKKLLYEISDEAYMNDICDDREESLSKCYQNWLDYCIFVDKIKQYIYMVYSEEFYSKNQNIVRDGLYEASKIFPNTFLDEICKYLQNYNLNQHKQAKIDAFLKLDLPHIYTEEIAEKFVNIYLKSISK